MMKLLIRLKYVQCICICKYYSIFSFPQDDEDDDEDVEEMPPDLANLSPEEQQRQLKIKAAWILGVGTLLVCIFSDPMVDVLDQIGVRTVRDDL